MRYAREKYAGRTYDGDSGIDYDEQSFLSVTDTSSLDVLEHLENGWNNILQCSGEPPHQFGLKIIRSVQWVVGLSHNEKAKAKREVKGWKHKFYRDVKPLRSGKYNEQQMTSKPNPVVSKMMIQKSVYKAIIVCNKFFRKQYQLQTNMA